ncbi:HigA family addiction module antidote protein [Paracoccus sp. Z118]|uniref:HigA family addiction module antitoxin n=1 Tax=Paracoccus sp. Z118 TaxID=2851017 RepID=UPI001C2BCE62|nr:HigA family addiction module antitoxin [Paracoccus sp. Z118]MBV0893488.1 HigA family addiction module antidote protein [Paracoccus sp. Z118]
MAEAWSPDWAVHPGEHLAEYIESRGWSQAEFARLADLTPKLVSTIINGSNPVSAETALKFEHVLGMKADIWTALQAEWDLHEAREARRREIENCREFLDRFPVKELVERNVLPKGAKVEELCERLLSFLGIGSPDAFASRLRNLAVQHRHSRSFNSEEGHVAAWLMLGELRARAMQLPVFDEARFQASVREIRGLTCEQVEVFAPQMINLCAKSGVALVFEPPLSKTRLFGSARWLDGSRAIIQMSLRMKSNDHFWWTFFHEAGHITLHRGRTFADDQGGIGDGAENEADVWAEEQLVGRSRFSEFCRTVPRSEAAVRNFADEVGLHPGIIVGMLQHRGILPFAHLNGLKARFEWADAKA